MPAGTPDSIARRGLRVLPWALLLLALVALSHTYWVPAPRTGEQLAGAEPVQPLGRVFTVTTWNIHSGKGVDGRTPLTTIADLLAEPPAGIIGLNEVKDYTFTPGNQGEDIAGLLAANWLFAPTAHRVLARELGNAVISNASIDSFSVEPLPYSHETAVEDLVSHSHRNLVTLNLTAPGGPFRVLVTHLDRGPLRRQQLAYVLARLQEGPRAILLGDLNSEDEELAPLLDGQTVDAVCGDTGAAHIDHILVRGFAVEARGSHPIGPSDHPAYWARLRDAAL